MYHERKDGLKCLRIGPLMSHFAKESTRMGEMQRQAQEQLSVYSAQVSELLTYKTRFLSLTDELVKSQGFSAT